MRIPVFPLVFLAFGIPLTTAQTTADFRFVHLDSVQQIQEVLTVIRNTGDIADVSLDPVQPIMHVQGTQEQVALASWFFNELDRPENPLELQGQGSSPEIVQYKLPGIAENTIRIFYLPYTKTVQEFQEVATAVRAATDIRRLFTVNAPRALAARGTDDQIALAAWLFNQFSDAPRANTAASPYRMPGGNDDVVIVLQVSGTETVQDFQEVATVVRSVADIRRLFTFNRPKKIVARGTSGQIALAGWLVHQLDSSASREANASEYHMSDTREYENVVHTFHLPQTLTVPDFQNTAASLRKATGMRRAFTYNRWRVLVMRGTMLQIEEAARLLAGAEAK